MNYIVFDLEWNQSPSGKDGENPHIPFEIINIGAVKLDNNLNIIDEFSVLIRPKIYRELNHITKDLTGFTMNELNRHGKKFTVACDEFIKWCGDDYALCTWGSLDIFELQRNMAYYKYPLLKAPVFFYDLQKIYSILYDNGKSFISLENAVDALNIPTNTNFHQALDDAYYTGLVLQKLDIDTVKKYYSVDYYQVPQNRNEEFTLVFDKYSKYVSKTFETKVDVMADRVVTSTVCYKCGQKLKKKIRFFSDNSRIYYCLCICPNDGYLKGKIRIKKTVNNKYFAVKTLKLTDESGAEAIRTRQIESKKKKAKKA